MPEPVGIVLEGIELSLERVEMVTRPVALEPNAVERMSHRIALLVWWQARPDAKLMIFRTVVRLCPRAKRPEEPAWYRTVTC